MDLDAKKPIFLGVCYKYSKEFKMDVRTVRVLTALMSVFFGPTVILYVALGVLNTPSAPRQDDEIIVNGVREYEDSDE